MTEKTFLERAKAEAESRRRRLIKKLFMSVVPLRMFRRNGAIEQPSDLERNIEIGNTLHLMDLQRERDKK